MRVLNPRESKKAPLAYLDTCLLSYRAYIMGGRSKKCLLERSQFEQQIRNFDYFSLKVHELSGALSYQVSS